MAGGDAVAIGNGERQHAGHAAALVRGFRGFEDIVVSGGDGAADAALGGAVGDGELARDHLYRKFRGTIAGGVAADAINDKENSVRLVDVDAIFVAGPATDVRGHGAAECGQGTHRRERLPQLAAASIAATARKARTKMTLAPAGRVNVASMERHLAGQRPALRGRQSSANLE